MKNHFFRTFVLVSFVAMFSSLPTTVNASLFQRLADTFAVAAQQNGQPPVMAGQQQAVPGVSAIAAQQQPIQQVQQMQQPIQMAQQPMQPAYPLAQTPMAQAQMVPSQQAMGTGMVSQNMYQPMQTQPYAQSPNYVQKPKSGIKSAIKGTLAGGVLGALGGIAMGGDKKQIAQSATAGAALGGLAGGMGATPVQATGMVNDMNTCTPGMIGMYGNPYMEYGMMPGINGEYGMPGGMPYGGFNPNLQFGVQGQLPNFYGMGQHVKNMGKQFLQGVQGMGQAFLNPNIQFGVNGMMPGAYGYMNPSMQGGMQGGYAMPGAMVYGGVNPNVQFGIQGQLPNVHGIKQNIKNMGSQFLQGMKNMGQHLNPQFQYGMQGTMGMPYNAGMNTPYMQGNFGFGMEGQMTMAPSSFPCQQCMNPQFNMMSGGRCQQYCESAQKIEYDPLIQNLNKKYQFRGYGDNNYKYNSNSNSKYKSKYNKYKYDNYNKSSNNYGSSYSQGGYGYDSRYGDGYNYSRAPRADMYDESNAYSDAAKAYSKDSYGIPSANRSEYENAQNRYSGDDYNLGQSRQDQYQGRYE